MIDTVAPKIYTIPSGIPFAKSLAGKLLKDTGGRPEQLSKVLILLPTRRGCRVLRDSFLALSEGKPLLLPKMQTLGDIDEEELSLSMAAQAGLSELFELPPAISPFKRQLLLARTIMGLPDFGQGPDHALALANSLARLMDQIYTENLDLANISQLVPAEFADHWQITIEFLKILSERWPEILKAHGVIDVADRRNRLILALNRFWKTNQPDYPIIAAGSTGSIPATASLLSTISTLPQGQVVLPGFDMQLDEETWQNLEESHPQFGFRQLLSGMGAERAQVQLWDSAHDSAVSAARRALSAEFMRPADNTAHWMGLKDDQACVRQFEAGLQDLAYFECTHENEEAQTIALLMRETLESPGKTAALITPDRDLARRVAVACKRWDISIDDSAGQTLDQLSLGVFFILCAQTCLKTISPISLLSVLKHEYAGLSRHKDVLVLEAVALRGPPPAPGFEGIKNRLVECGDDAVLALELINDLEGIFQPLIALSDGLYAFKDFARAHIQVAENLAGSLQLWRGEAGEAAAQLFTDIIADADLIGELSLKHYCDILWQFFKNTTVRPAYGTQPRLMILGQLEARLIDADLVILGGLNEGTWPPDPTHDPWMSRPMRQNFGLPGPERSLGLAAHDFVQGFCAPHVALTRAKKQGGSPTVPARWLQRLHTVLSAVDISDEHLRAQPHLYWVRTLDAHQKEQPFTRPAPTPPVDKRPAQISASRVETWLKDPYSIYARHVLKLKKLDPLEQDVDAARRGTLLHDILEHFIRVNPEEIPDNAIKQMEGDAQEELAHYHDDPAVWSFWWPRFYRLAAWFIEHEQQWRAEAKPFKTEVSGAITINNFMITARADRIDRMHGGAAIIDYKSGGTYSQKGIKSGDFPQLAVEALILHKDGFEGLAPHLQYLGYWTMTGGSEPGKVTAVTNDLDEIIARAEEGMTTLIEIFGQQDTPYYSLPRPDRAPRFNDYEHLARVKEWTALGDVDSVEAA